MSDHTDFIAIRGLQSAATEVFWGIGGAALSVEGPGGGGSGGTTVEWGEIPSDIITMISDYTQSLNDWMANAVRYDPDSGTRALIPELLDDLPVVPMALATVATGGLSLPAVATTMIAQVIMNHAGAAVANYAESLDENSPQNILKKAFLWDNDGTLESILKTAMLRVSDTEKSITRERLTALIAELTNTTEAVTNLEQPLKDLALVDATIEAGNDLKVRVKGKALEF